MIETTVRQHGRCLLKGMGRDDTAQLRRAAKRLAARGRVRVVRDHETDAAVAVPPG